MVESMRKRFSRVHSFGARHARKFVACFFAALLAIGVLVYDDYGVPVDTLTENIILTVNLDSMARTLLPESWYEALKADFAFVSDIESYLERDHGQAVFYPLAPAVWLHLKGDISRSSLYLIRHLYNFLFCWLALICLYATVRRLFGRRLYGIIAVLFVFLTPRFFAESFYNNKDIVAYATCILMIWAAERFFRKQSPGSAVLLGAMCALSVHTRLPTVLFPLLAFVFYIVSRIVNRKDGRKTVFLAALCVVSAAIAFYLITPAMWRHPLDYLHYLLTESMHFSRWGDYYLFDGRVWNSVTEGVPKYYLPLWFAVTTPIPILAAASIGFVAAVAVRIRPGDEKNDAVDEKRVAAFVLLCACFSILSFALPPMMNALVYNSWRHLFFAYSGVVVAAIYGLRRLMRIPFRTVRAASALACVLAFAHIAGWMLANHPFQFVYFNAFAGRPAGQSFETDYWSVAHNELVKRAFERDPDGAGDICFVSLESIYSGAFDDPAMLLTDDWRKRFHALEAPDLKHRDPSDGDYYYFVNYTCVDKYDRLGRKLYLDENQGDYTSLELVDEIVVDEYPIYRLYKLTQDNLAYIRDNMTAEIKITSFTLRGKRYEIPAYYHNDRYYYNVSALCGILRGDGREYRVEIDGKDMRADGDPAYANDATGLEGASAPDRYLVDTRLDQRMTIDGKLFYTPSGSYVDNRGEVYASVRELGFAFGFLVDWTAETGVSLRLLE